MLQLNSYTSAKEVVFFFLLIAVAIIVANAAVIVPLIKKNRARAYGTIVIQLVGVGCIIALSLNEPRQVFSALKAYLAYYCLGTIFIARPHLSWKQLLVTVSFGSMLIFSATHFSELIVFMAR